MLRSKKPSRRAVRGGCAIVLAFWAVLATAAPASALFGDPLFILSPSPPPPPAMPNPLPTGYLNDPCGLAVTSSGDFYVSDHYHRAVDLYGSNASYQSQPLAAYTQPDSATGMADDPCGLALDSSGTLYLNNYHRNVVRFGAPISLGTGTVLAGSGEATGVAVDPATDHVFVDVRDHVNEYDPSGAFVREIGASSLQDGYGIAVSGYGPTAGYLYVPDAADGTVKTYDPATDTSSPVEVIDANETPNGGFISLSDAAIAVDDESGDVYVTDDVQPVHSESPQAIIYGFDASGAYEGHLKYAAIDAASPGLAVDNTGGATQGRVYVSSGNTHHAGVYAYPPGSLLKGAPLPPTVPSAPLGGGKLFPTVAIGGAAGGLGCEGDACQVLPPEPFDPTLTTLLSGHGNPKPRYARYNRRTGAKRKHNSHRHRESRDARSSASPVAGPLASASTALGTASAAGASSDAGGVRASGTVGSHGASTPGGAAILLSGGSGLEAAAWADGGAPASLAGSHPYELDLSLGLDQSGGQADLREADISLPPGFLLNPANATGVLCSDTAFATPRSSSYEASQSGEDCPDRAQVGTIEATATGQTRTFGIYNLQPHSGEAARFGAAPFGRPLAFGMQVRSDARGTYLALVADEVPEALGLEALGFSLWGTPWDATHDSERGDCLNEAEPSFGWGKCSIGDPLFDKPLAFLTLPTQCGSPLSFTAEVGSWQQSASESREAQTAAPVSDCASLRFDFHPEGLLSVKKASSASGYVFRFANEDEALTDPRARIRSMVKKTTVQLPTGMSLNPSVGAGLGTCAPGQLAGETASNRAGAGCPGTSKIGVFSVALPFYRSVLRGSIYLAKPYDNPFSSLLAVYLVAKSADRGALITVAGKLTPDPGDGTLTATFDNLPQLPYTDLEVNFRSGQRAPLISPPHCGNATSTLTLAPWAQGVTGKVLTTDSPIDAGSEAGPCPAPGIPPFRPEAVTGGINANVGSYTPYYVHLARKDTEQEITSYSLVLPKGITGKLAGVPFCPEQDISAARRNDGVAEQEHPSCPAASQVGRTDTGYGVGDALTYAKGRIYLAGPYHGAPLSLVTVNSATVGPFDLGTIVIRSAFQVDQHTAQLRIDSRASDPIPHIIDGIPLHLRDVRIYMDRFQFTHNPSSCEPSQLESTLTGSGATFESKADDSTATVAKRFQLLNCLTLGFHPKLGMRLRGSSRRGDYPSLRASFVSRGAKDSNLKRIEVQMPHAEFLAQNHIRTICTRAQFAQERCPAGSAYGSAVAKTLLFDEPLRGKVYLRSSSSKIPDLVADLHAGAVRIAVEGRIGPGRNGGIRVFFDNLPDAPVDSFTMTLYGGKRGLLQNSTNICANPPLAAVKALGQNNRGAIFTAVLRGQCNGAKPSRGR